MGDFEVSLSFNIRAADRFDAAARVYALIEAAPPTHYWVCNEGGVGDEVQVTPAKENVPPVHGASSNVGDLAEELYRLGVQYGAGSMSGSEQDHRTKVEDLKKRIVDAFLG